MDDDKPQPVSTHTTSTKSEFPDELKPYITDILKQSRDRAEAQYEGGYQKFPGPRIAEFSQETQDAQELLKDQVGASSQYMAPARDLMTQSTSKWNDAARADYMNPYMQDVVDIQKRKADQLGDVREQSILDKAGQSGGFGGSRHAILEAAQGRDEGQLMNDIQKQGSHQAYETGLQTFLDQKRREAGGAQGLAALGQTHAGLTGQEIAGLAGVGAQKEGQAQRGLDLGYQEFMREQAFPDEVLSRYSNLIRGHMIDPSKMQTQTTVGPQAPAPNRFTQMLGIGATGAGIYGNMGGNFGTTAMGKAMGFANKGGGIASLNTGGAPNPYNDSKSAGHFESNPMDKISEDYIARLVRRAQEGNLTPAEQKMLDLVKKRSDSRSKTYEKSMEDIKHDKFLALSKMGLNMIKAGSAGKGVLTAGAEAGEGMIDSLSAAKKAETAAGAAQTEGEFEDAKAEYGLEATRQGRMDESAKALMEYNAKIAAAKGKNKEEKLKRITSNASVDIAKEIFGDAFAKLAKNKPVLSEGAAYAERKAREYVNSLEGPVRDRDSVYFDTYKNILRNYYTNLKDTGKATGTATTVGSTVGARPAAGDPEARQSLVPNAQGN